MLPPAFSRAIAALLAQRAHARGEAVAPALAMPLYVRDRVALTIDERRAASAARAAGGSVDVVDLPEIGIRGNSHMIMMDRNSDAVAEVVQRWLAQKGLWR